MTLFLSITISSYSCVNNVAWGAFPLSSSQASSMVCSATFLLAAASKNVAEQTMLDACDELKGNAPQATLLTQLYEEMVIDRNKVICHSPE